MKFNNFSYYVYDRLPSSTDCQIHRRGAHRIFFDDSFLIRNKILVGTAYYFGKNFPAAKLNVFKTQI